jgi:DNA-binding NarL/FixJ family response regulator
MKTVAEFVEGVNALIERNHALEARVKQLESQVPDNRPKLTREDVSKIHELKRAGYKQSEIAEIFDVNPATVSRIVRGLYY